MSYAQITTRTAFLFTDFGMEMAARYFPNEVLEALPRYKRGKHIGKPKGMLHWAKVDRGGWVRTAPATASGSATGYVENRVGSVIWVNLCDGEFGVMPEEQKIIATWSKE